MSEIKEIVQQAVHGIILVIQSNKWCICKDYFSEHINYSQVAHTLNIMQFIFI